MYLQNMRRLPIYLLINTSSAISNETLRNFNDCIKLLIETLQEDPYALETAHISIITFDNTITKLCSLSPLSSFKIPSIKLGRNESSLEYIFLQLSPIIDDELIKTTSEKIGDWKPLVFIFSDNDSVINITREEAESIYHKCGRIIVCTNKDSINGENYKNITETILSIESLDKLTIKSLFRWVSESIDVGDKVDCYEIELELPPPPSSVYIDIESNYSEQKITYESVCQFTTLPDNTRLKKLKIEYEKTISSLNREQKRLKSFQSQIDELKKKNNEIEIRLKNSPGMIAGTVGGFLSSIIGGLTGIAGALAGSTSTSSDEAKEKLLECDKELEAKLAQAQMCKKQIEEFKQQKSNLEKELAILEEQNIYNDVYSSIFAPAEVKRKSHLQVQVYLHLYEESEKVKSLAKESDKNAERRDYIPLSLKLRKGDKIDIEFNVYGETRLMSERKSIVWQGSFTKCSFDYFVPKDIDVEELSCEANLFVNGAMIGEMRFLTQIVEVPRNLNPEILSHRFNKIFISYAHQDAQQIKLLALAYKAQGVDYFYDRDSLAPGDVYEEKIFDYIDSSDLFVLCWSKNAAVSDYVAKEKGRALFRAYPKLSQRDATLKICPISIEPRADLPSDMKKVYNFEVI